MSGLWLWGSGAAAGHGEQAVISTGPSDTRFHNGILVMGGWAVIGAE